MDIEILYAIAEINIKLIISQVFQTNRNNKLVPI